MKNGIRKFLEFIKKIMPLIIIIAIFLTIKFNPKWLTDFLGITDAQGGVSDLISYIELMIEFGFLYFVLKEFKMTKEEFKMTRKEFEITRKNFEWQKKEQQEKADKEANRQLTEIVKFFARQYVLEQIELANQLKRDKLYRELSQDAGKYIKEKEEFLELLQKDYKEKTKKDVNKQESLAINRINESFYEKKYVCINKNNNIRNYAKKSIVWQMENDTLEDINNIRLCPETAKHMGIDYKILEKIYNNILYKDYDN